MWQDYTPDRFGMFNKSSRLPQTVDEWLVLKPARGVLVKRILTSSWMLWAFFIVACRPVCARPARRSRRLGRLYISRHSWSASTNAAVRLMTVVARSVRPAPECAPARITSPADGEKPRVLGMHASAFLKRLMPELRFCWRRILEPTV
jgi:hypothetical protein